ncbi:4Fe-4S binding protein [Raoultibacter massiliensis]|uniref:4Fe-4S binding protein n=1 Tax=Raoultibacter massiliensis TaxID=1852371 RepID=UPI000C829748|nr:4Fe-4S dicluster domain-containing protein [Raoultibacter massiliensis]
MTAGEGAADGAGRRRAASAENGASRFIGGRPRKHGSGAVRQRVRRLLLLVSFLLFPITIFYFSPVLIIEGALTGVVVASALVFTAQFLLSLVCRRTFCGWLCAAGGLQELESTVVGKPAKLGWRTRIKYVIWVPWLASIIVCAWVAGGFTLIDPLAGIPGGVSLNNPLGLPIYFGIVALFFVPNLFLGRRAMCHCVCWMAPFMVIGGKLGRAARLPQLRIVAEPEACIACGRCTKACPMSLDMQELLASGDILDAECIQCAACADACPKDVLALRCSR